jgi:hypothetical protein
MLGASPTQLRAYTKAALVEHEGYFTEDSEVIDFFAPVREDFLFGVPPPYMRAS